MLHGDFGPSYIYRDFTVAQLIAPGLPYSLQLGSFALHPRASVGGVAAGVVAALRQNGAVDYAVMGFATIGLTVPNFVVGAGAVSSIFAVMLALAAGRRLGRRRLPRPRSCRSIALALPQLAIFARLTRGSMIETLRADHVRTARAYGLPAARRRRHPCAARRAAAGRLLSRRRPPPRLLTGSVVVETIFAIPGVGRYFVKARSTATTRW